MIVVTRFAPSPTGRLHAGHAVSALLAHDRAREAGGRFLLRIEDIDPGRARPEHIDGILADLAWLGVEPDGPVVRQSQRLPLYAEALDRLRDMGVLYPCFCTRTAIAAEIAGSASAPHGPSGVVYPGTCRRLGHEERARRQAQEPHAWRIDMAAALARVGETPLRFHDVHAGWVDADPAAHGDVVLARKDAPVSYHLAVTVDDAAQGVTLVTRGVDLFHATDIHRLLQALLNLPVPAYEHHAMLLDADGRPLAKRNGAAALADLRADGVDGRASADTIRAARAALDLDTRTPTSVS